MIDKDFDVVEFASLLSTIRQNNRESHPDIFAEMDKELAEEDAIRESWRKKGIMNYITKCNENPRLCDPFDIMRFAKKLKAKEAAEKLKSDKEKDER